MCRRCVRCGSTVSRRSASIGCIAVGFANSAVWTLAPVYAQAHGLNKGWIADLHECLHARRRADPVAAGALVGPHRPARSSSRPSACWHACSALRSRRSAARIAGRSCRSSACFGMVALPLYGLSVAHANDRIARQSFVETSATLLLINSLASVIGPTLAALFMGRAGNAGAVLLYRRDPRCDGGVHDCPHLDARRTRRRAPRALRAATAASHARHRRIRSAQRGGAVGGVVTPDESSFWMRL